MIMQGKRLYVVENGLLKNVKATGLLSNVVLYFSRLPPPMNIATSHQWSTKQKSWPHLRRAAGTTFSWTKGCTHLRQLQLRVTPHALQVFGHPTIIKLASGDPSSLYCWLIVKCEVSADLSLAVWRTCNHNIWWRVKRRKYKKGLLVCFYEAL